MGCMLTSLSCLKGLGPANAGQRRRRSDGPHCRLGCVPRWWRGEYDVSPRVAGLSE